MYWNYRVIRDRDIYGEYFCTLHEVYYDVEGNIESWTQNACTPLGDNEVGLLSDLLRMARAVTFPVLDMAELQGHYSGDKVQGQYSGDKVLDNDTGISNTIDITAFIEKHKN